MLAVALVAGLFLCALISVYLLLFSPYRIRNWRGFLLLFSTVTVHSMFIWLFPLCQLYLIYFVLFVDLQSFHAVYHSAVVFYCVAESLFFFFTVEEARALNDRPLPRRPRLPKDYDEQFVDRVLKVYEKSKADFRVCFAGWFEGVQEDAYDGIYEDNVLQFIAMSTYGAQYWEEMSDKQQKRIQRLYERYFDQYPEQRSKVKPGYNEQIRLRHPFKDQIHYTHYPMIKYVLFACVRSITIRSLTSIGYEYQIIDQVPFYVKKRHNDTKFGSPPILFLHGLSLGTNTYISFIRRLSSLDRTIILIDIPHASMRLHTEVLSMSTIISSIEQLLKSIDAEKVVTISHSYGTIVHSCLIKQLPRFVRKQPVIFVDPVCFLLFDPHYIDNFIYRQPRTPNQLLLYASCTEDLYSIYHIERHLCWYECTLWSEDVRASRARIHVFFSENDDIVPVTIVNDYLQKAQIETTVFRQFKHGQFLISAEFQENVLLTVERLQRSAV